MDELLEAEALIDKGFFFEIGNRKWEIKPFTLDTILRANIYAVKLKINTEEEKPLTDIFKENVKPLTDFIAVSILQKRWKCFLFKNLFSRYLRKNLTPQKAVGLTLTILKMYDMGNFITSIRLIGQMTITAPKQTERIDGNP